MNARPTLEVTTLQVRSLEPSAEATSVRQRYEAEFGEPPEEPGGWYRPDDWRRTSFVLQRLRPGGRVLDVGAGAGQFANMIAATEQFGTVAALDHTRFKKYREFHPSIERHDASIVELPFPDDHFDVVTCMEVLEHVPDDVFEPGLAELRRVCRSQLIVSVPYREQEPLSKGHLRRFEPADIADHFPDAQLIELQRPRMPWMIIEERLDGSPFDRRPVGVDTTVSTERLTADQQRIRWLEAEVARLRSRRSVRFADALGSVVRRARRLLGRLRRGR